MIQKLILILFPLLSLALFAFFYQQKTRDVTQISNHTHTPIEFKDNTLQCPRCFMYLVGKKHTAQVIDTKGKTLFFDDIGCVILWLRDQKIEPKQMVIWAFSLDTHRYIDAFKAHYSLTEATPMEYGFGVYENAKEGSIGFDEMRLKMLRGENMSDPKVRQKLLGREP